MRTWVLAGLLAAVLAAGVAFGNGGPFVIKYPGGDPAAKGVLARLDPSLKPDRETRLRVVKEDLTVCFQADRFAGTARADAAAAESTPLVAVAAAYTIENPTSAAIEVDFGFPILRGLYMNPLAMMPMPDALVTIEDAAWGKPQHLRPFLISNSIIYGVVRQRAREAIEKGIAADGELARLVADLRGQAGEARAAAKEALVAHLRWRKEWNARDAALLAEYASIQFSTGSARPFDRGFGAFAFGDGPDNETARKLLVENLGPLAAIGEQKATQFLACLAARFDPATATAYEEIFSAWGGDVRERALDLATGQLRPREIALDTEDLKNGATSAARRYLGDPTIYARVEYLDPNAKISEEEKAACRAILKNLPVVFTFAPMNLLYYRVAFPAKSTRVLTVSYRQHAFLDTRAPKTYQCAYVIHPASLWQDFGPINIEVYVREGVPFRGSVAFARAEVKGVPPPRAGVFGGGASANVPHVYRATLTGPKTGELYLAVDAEAWTKSVRTPTLTQAAGRQ